MAYYYTIEERHLYPSDDANGKPWYLIGTEMTFARAIFQMSRFADRTEPRQKDVIQYCRVVRYKHDCNGSPIEDGVVATFTYSDRDYNHAICVH